MLRGKYVEHVTEDVCAAWATRRSKAAAEAKAVMAIETALAKGSVARVDLRDPDKRYHVMTVAHSCRS